MYFISFYAKKLDFRLPGFQCILCVAYVPGQNIVIDGGYTLGASGCERNTQTMA